VLTISRLNNVNTVLVVNCNILYKSLLVIPVVDLYNKNVQRFTLSHFNKSNFVLTLKTLRLLIGEILRFVRP
jgi:hypothetical protein